MENLGHAVKALEERKSISRSPEGRPKNLNLLPVTWLEDGLLRELRQETGGLTSGMKAMDIINDDAEVV